MNSKEWVKEISHSFKHGCGNQEQFQMLFSMPDGVVGDEAIPAVEAALLEAMPHGLFEAWEDEHSQLHIRKYVSSFA